MIQVNQINQESLKIFQNYKITKINNLNMKKYRV